MGQLENRGGQDEPVIRLGESGPEVWLGSCARCGRPMVEMVEPTGELVCDQCRSAESG